MLAAARVDGSRWPLRPRPGVHVVRSGDSLWRIAKRHRMDVATLARLNGMGPGDTLACRPEAGAQHAARPRRTAAAARSSSGSSREVSYKVRSGDTLSRIAQVFGVTVSDLVNWNGISKHVDAASRPETHGQRPPALISSPAAVEAGRMPASQLVCNRGYTWVS